MQLNIFEVLWIGGFIIITHMLSIYIQRVTGIHWTICSAILLSIVAFMLLIYMKIWPCK